MGKPLAYHLTWTTYGTWLSGDARGWVRRGEMQVRAGDPEREKAARAAMTEPAVVLDAEQRALVEATIGKHCSVRGWALHAVNARSNHVHVVVTADAPPERVMEQLRAWCTRRLNERDAAKGRPRRKRWWTYHGSTRWINDERYFAEAVGYVSERQ